ncbi:MAG: hypothetical protein WAM82_35865 [Thermoanaerobaculia bacterium]
MSRRTARQGVASLALVLTLILVGAQPAAAADRTAMERFASFWGAVLDTVPGAHAMLDTLTGWLTKSTAEPPVSTNRGFGIDPNGNSNELIVQPPPPASSQN